MRLIDADKFKAYVIDGFEQNKDLFDNEHRGFAKAITQGFLADIDEQPTEYDINKVVEQLEANKSFVASIAFEHTFGLSFPHIVNERCYGKFVAYENAIEIVKKGGAE